MSIMKEKILIVDDDSNILAAFERQLRHHFELVTVDNATQALLLLKQRGPFAVVVSDYRMPQINGLQFLGMVKKLAPETVRMMLTGHADMQVAIDAINEGNLFRFLIKPCPSSIFINAIRAGIEQYRLIRAEKELLSKTLQGSVKLLIDLLSIMNPLAFSTAVRIRDIARGIALRLQMEKIWVVELTAMLSQIGCVALPGVILEKWYKGEQLTDSEKEVFLQHPQTGRKLLSNIPRLSEVAEAVAYQFKHFDGSGVPSDEKKGHHIPLPARILKLVLDYDLMLRLGYQARQCLDILRRSISTRYDPDIFAALEAEVLSVKEGFVVRAIPLSELVSGMILADDVKDREGNVLIPAGYEVSEVYKLRLQNFARFNNLIEPIKIMERFGN